MGVAVLLLVTATASARTRREFRSVKLGELSDQAYFAAEAGFNMARAELIRCGGNPLTLNGQSGVLQYTTPDGQTGTAGTYSITVAATGASSYLVTSVGTLGASPYAVKRVVSGDIWVKNRVPTSLGQPCQRMAVGTQYR